jgi:hypothetical protein
VAPAVPVSLTGTDPALALPGDPNLAKGILASGK